MYNLLGQEVLTLVDIKQPPGVYQVIFNRNDFSDKSLSSGIYFYIFEAGNFRVKKKMVMFR